MGRSVYDNVCKFVQYQLTINIVALSVTIIGAWSRYTSPLAAGQLLWVNLILDSLAALSLGTEKPTLRLLERRPYKKDVSIVSKLMMRNMLGNALGKCCHATGGALLGAV